MKNAVDSIAEDTVFAGFGPRLVAYILDFIVVIAMSMALSFVAGIVAVSLGSNQDELAFTLVGVALGFACVYFNEVYLVASKTQASLGKRAMGLKVIGARGQRIGQGTALLRFICTYISGLIFGIGYLMIAFTERKRALHDMIAETYVVVARKPTGPSPSTRSPPSA